MNTENKRIPFDWEKYQSGEYQAVCRNDEKPEMIIHNPNAKKIAKIAMWVNGHLYSLNENGKSWNVESPIDLFLIPKPKRFQAWVNLYSNGAAQSFVTKEVADEFNRFHIVNGVVRVECRLIEWEG